MRGDVLERLDGLVDVLFGVLDADGPLLAGAVRMRDDALFDHPRPEQGVEVVVDVRHEVPVVVDVALRELVDALEVDVLDLPDAARAVSSLLVSFEAMLGPVRPRTDDDRSSARCRTQWYLSPSPPMNLQKYL